MRGAGGTNGGTGSFLIGIIMMCVGFYMLTQAINVSSTFGMRTGLYSFTMLGHMRTINTGMVLVPFIFGISMIFYNSKNILGWVLTVGSISALLFGVISSINFHMRSMSSFELITMVVLAFGGTGLFLKSLKNHDDDSKKISKT